MVSSQVHSQHPSYIPFLSMGKHRSWAFNKADVRGQEAETSKSFRPSNSTPDSHFMSSNGHACPGHANMTSPLNSFWIQRLIPSQNIRVEQWQPSDKLDRDDYSIDGLQANLNKCADYLGNQSDIPVFENSRRSKRDFFSSHKLCHSIKPLGTHMGKGFNARHFEAPDALPPESYVLPKSLPVMESLLPGCSEKARENQIFPEANMPHVLSRFGGFAKPVKQTVHYSADEKSRVSYTSIEALNCRRVVCAPGDLLPLKTLQQRKRGIPLQPCSEFSFHSNDAVAPNIDTIFSGKDKQRDTILRTYRNSTQTEDAFATLYNDSHTCWDSSVLKGPVVKNRQLDGYKTLNNGWYSKKRSSHAHDGSEALYEREGSYDGGWWSFQYKEKDELRQVSNVVKEKAGIYLPHQMIEQDSDSSHEDQGGTSRSFSFHFENVLATEDLSKAVTRKGQWPFSPSILSSQHLCQPERSENIQATGLANANVLGIPCDKSFSFPDLGLCEAGTNCICRNHPSTFFGMENSNKSSSCRIFNKHDVSPHNAACIDIGGVHRGQMQIEAWHATGVDHSLQTLKSGFVPGKHPFSGLESNSMIERAEGKEPMQSFPLFRLSSQRSTPTCPPEGAQSNHADGNHTSGNQWQAHVPLIRGNNYPCPRESTQLNNDGGNSCSIGSCSERPSNLCSDDPSTSVDAKSQSSAPETPVPLQEQLYSSPHANIGVNTSSGEQGSTGKEATSWEALGSGTRKNVWMKRWSTLKSKEVQPASKPNEEGVALTSMRRSRIYDEDLYMSQGVGEFSCRFDARPSKRVCQEERSVSHYDLGIALPKSGSAVAVGKDDDYQAPASHFMKHFFTPSMGAMAIMGMTARKVKATQPLKSGLFGSWALNALPREPSRAWAEACKEFVTTMPDCKKNISYSEAMVPTAQVDP